MKKRSNYNRGFTMVEIVLAVALLMICITPAMQSFITSAIVNRDARQLMGATEVGETIVEGFANKNYEDVKLLLGSDGASGIDNMDLQGRYVLSSISDNAFNMSANSEMISTFNKVVSVNQATIDYSVGGGSVTFNNEDVISGNNATGSIGLSQKLINDDFYANIVLRHYTSSMASTAEDPKLYYWYSPGGMMSCMCFSNIRYGGYTYDVVMSFLPTARDNDPGTIYYSYSVFTSVYCIDGGATNVVLDSVQASLLLSHDPDAIQPIITMCTGMRAN